MGVILKVQGLDKLQKALKNNYDLSDVKKVVKSNGAQLQQKMQREAVFIHGYSTGTTKRSIGIELADGGYTAIVAPRTEYAAYVEYGTRFMEAQPFVRPAFDVQKVKFISDLKRLMK